MNTLIQFLLEVKSELSKVVWPSRNDTLRYTFIVVVFSLLIAVILGAADYGLIKLLQKFVTRQ